MGSTETGVYHQQRLSLPTTQTASHNSISRAVARRLSSIPAPFPQQTHSLARSRHPAKYNLSAYQASREKNPTLTVFLSNGIYLKVYMNFWNFVVQGEAKRVKFT